MMFLPVVWSCKNFYPRPPRGGRPPTTLSSELKKLFLSTPSARRATQGRFWLRCKRQNFYPRPPRGGRPMLCRSANSATLNFYPRPPRGGRQIVKAKMTLTMEISIHALREEGDHAFVPSSLVCSSYFYPRPPRGGRPPSKDILMGLPLFLSTPSARRATKDGTMTIMASKFLSTPSARRAT